MAERPDSQVVFHNWWNGPRTWAVVSRSTPSVARFVARELPVDAPAPASSRQPSESPWRRARDPDVADPAACASSSATARYGGAYRRPQADWQAVWAAGVDEVRELLVDAWR